MKIVELDDSLMEGDGKCVNTERRVIVGVDAKRALVGAGARILFYPTLLYNVFRNKIQSEFRWWDQIDQVYFFLNINLHSFPQKEWESRTPKVNAFYFPWSWCKIAY